MLPPVHSHKILFFIKEDMARTDMRIGGNSKLCHKKSISRTWGCSAWEGEGKRENLGAPGGT